MDKDYEVWVYQPGRDADGHHCHITHRELEFATFCIEILRAEKRITSQEAYKLLTTGGNIMDSFLLPNYEILHSQSREYVLQEMLTLLKGEAVC